MRIYQDRVMAVDFAGHSLAVAGRRAARWMAGVMAGWQAARERARTLRELRGLSDSTLQDIGLHRSNLLSAVEEIERGRDPRGLGLHS